MRGSGTWARDRRNIGTTVCARREQKESVINPMGDL